MFAATRTLLVAAVTLALAACDAPAGEGDHPSPVAALTIPEMPAPRSTPTAPAATSTPSPRDAVVATFDIEDVPEASGLVHSLREDDLVWVVDDGPGTTHLVAVRLGRGGASPEHVAGAVQVAGLVGTDTEALAAGACARDDERPCLFIGDIGDNERGRAAVEVHRILEPDLSFGLPAEPVRSDVATLTYPDAPTDAEAMIAVDGRLLIITKAVFDEETRTTGPTRLFEAASFDDQQLVARGEVPVPRPSVGLAAKVVGNVVTGADVAAGRVVIRTYDHALLFTPDGTSGDETDIAAFPTWPFAEVPSSGPLQTEAIAFDLSGSGAEGAPCATLAAGEATGTIWRTPLPSC